MTHATVKHILDGHAMIRRQEGNALISSCLCGFTLTITDLRPQNLVKFAQAEDRHVREAEADDALAADPMVQFCPDCDALHRVGEHVCHACGYPLNARGDCEECLTLRQGNS